MRTEFNSLFRTDPIIRGILSFPQMIKLLLDGNSESGAHVWSGTGNLICLRHLLRFTAVGSLCFFLQKTPAFLHRFPTCSELPSDISIMLT